MTRTQTVGWAEPAKLKEGNIGHRAGTLRPSRRCTWDFDATCLNHSLPGTNVGWMTLHPSTNVRQVLILNPNQNWKTPRGLSRSGPPACVFPLMRSTAP